MSFRLDGKVALVTGGSRGIGLETAKYRANRGAKLFLVDVDEAGLAATVQNLKEQGIEVASCKADISNSEQAQKAVDNCVEQFEKIDILVNNAGITRDNLSIRMKDEDWDLVLRVNLTGSFYMARAAAKQMMRARSGRIVNVASVVGVMGNAGQANYSASKAGVIGMTKSMAKELASRGVCVNAVAPGFIETQMTAVLKEETKNAVMATIPMSRYGKPEEVAAAIGFLASEEAAYITGQVLVIDGGLHM